MLDVASDDLNPLIHVPARLRIMATLATLPDGDKLSFARLQGLIGLTSGNLTTHLRRLQEAAYIDVEKTGTGAASLTTVRITTEGRRALDAYSAALRELLEGVGEQRTPRYGEPLDASSTTSHQ